MHVRKPIQDNSSGTITNNTRLMAPHKNKKCVINSSSLQFGMFMGRDGVDVSLSINSHLHLIISSPNPSTSYLPHGFKIRLHPPLLGLI